MPTCDEDGCNNEATARCLVCASIFCEYDCDGAGEECANWDCIGIMEEL